METQCPPMTRVGMPTAAGAPLVETEVRPLDGRAGAGVLAVQGTLSEGQSPLSVLCSLGCSRHVGHN